MIDFLKKITIRTWFVLGIFNLLLVASWGLLMRLKFVLPLPAVNQKYLLHAHSHFAFSGWVSHTLMALIAAAVCGQGSRGELPWKYQLIVAANLLASYGMLISFSLQGYGLYAICASSLTVVVSYVFAAMCWRDTRQPALGIPARNWLRASLVFLVLSSAGTFFLAYLMASRNTDNRIQLAAVYFFLHFQYNGWFFFACVGLLYHWLQRKGIYPRRTQSVFWLFALICAPTYFLSVLWWPMPSWLYLLVVAAVILQGGAWSIWLHSLLAKFSLYRHRLPAIAKWLLVGVAVAASIKIFLQGLSVIPSLSQLVYSFRPVVIGYLHLVLLVIITLFILAYAYMNGILRVNRVSLVSTGVLTAGIVLNELLLMLQGLSGLAGIFIGHIPAALVGASGIIFIGLIGLLRSQSKLTSRNHIDRVKSSSTSG